MEVTLKPDSQTVTHLWAINLSPTEIPQHQLQYARVTRLSPAFRVRVWLATRD